ncbi:unnamed protein product [Rhizophagus irregularis]|uniref:Uncharacterized protein n=1 Tax=Rhizophagus irregularis TaxID=588596 RepID=A0A2I1FVY9_9GLOM|nr:hypothetical protein RhiirA4_451562 [Rhizophagus irregularis]CAB4407982.1 unnamed protein product [Rhizophagus irregularis]CAB4408627.1 unnamed protein product [Rhizophagus irregularis]
MFDKRVQSSNYQSYGRYAIPPCLVDLVEEISRRRISDSNILYWNKYEVDKREDLNKREDTTEKRILKEKKEKRRHEREDAERET